MHHTTLMWCPACTFQTGFGTVTRSCSTTAACYATTHVLPSTHSAQEPGARTGRPCHAAGSVPCAQGREAAQTITNHHGPPRWRRRLRAVPRAVGTDPQERSGPLNTWRDANAGTTTGQLWCRAAARGRRSRAAADGAPDALVESRVFGREVDAEEVRQVFVDVAGLHLRPVAHRATDRRLRHGRGAGPRGVCW